MTARTAIAEAIEAHVPELAAEYANYAHRTFAGLVEYFGPTLKGVHNSRSAAAFRAISGALVRAKSDNPWEAGPLSICEQRLERWATEHAQAACEAWAAKIEGKIGAVENARVNRSSGGMSRFSVVGELRGRRVVLQQQRVLKVSPRGVLFHQFPALIYVDGKKVSEAAFKRLVASL